MRGRHAYRSARIPADPRERLPSPFAGHSAFTDGMALLAVFPPFVHVPRSQRPLKEGEGMRLIAAAFCVLFAPAVARAGTPAECGAPTAMSDEWPVSPPAQQGLDPELICATGPGLAKRTDAVPHGVV